MKKMLLVLLMVSMVFAQKQRTDRMINTKLMRADTLWVVADTALYTPIFWQTKANEKSIEISMDDTSATGFKYDSASITVTLKQVFDLGSTKLVRLYDSDAYTSGLVYDSLKMSDLDTTATWARATLPMLRYARDTVGYYGTDVLDSLTTSDAATYVQLVPDYSPGLCLLITGKADNKKGSANRVIIRWYQQIGLPIFGD